ncbi:MAG: HEAT repeat domain-containing protein [SAR324 cluster bacterium]|nr:HEAT repeat domain-containing protein [SAR324 cluster bacterium]
MDFHQILGVRPHASEREVRQAFRQAALRYHPDTALGGGDPHRFRLITEAYGQLRRQSKPPRSAASGFSDFPSQTTGTGGFSGDGIPMTLQELINCIEFSENRYVRQIAMETLAAQREEEGLQYLLDRMRDSNPEMQQSIIGALGQSGLQEASPALMSMVSEPTIEVSAAAIRSLERIDTDNRRAVISTLKKETRSIRKQIIAPLRQLRDLVSGVPPVMGQLGDILVRSQKLSIEQLEVSLLLQKRFPLLLGQVLRHLEYLSVPEIQQAVSFQRNLRY